jgi:hypothetical protein
MPLGQFSMPDARRIADATRWVEAHGLESRQRRRVPRSGGDAPTLATTARLAGYLGEIPPYYAFRGYLIPAVGAIVDPIPSEDDWLTLYTWRWPGYKDLRFCVPGIPFGFVGDSDVPVARQLVWNAGLNTADRVWFVDLTFNGYCVGVS